MCHVRKRWGTKKIKIENRQNRPKELGINCWEKFFKKKERNEIDNLEKKQCSQHKDATIAASNLKKNTGMEVKTEENRKYNF